MNRRVYLLVIHSEGPDEYEAFTTKPAAERRQKEIEAEIEPDDADTRVALYDLPMMRGDD